MVRSPATRGETLIVWAGLLGIVCLLWLKRPFLPAQETPFDNKTKQSSSSSSSTMMTTAFDNLIQYATSNALSNGTNPNMPISNATTFDQQRPLVTRDNLTEWKPYQTGGGLNAVDRITLSKVYHDANSVFEWGLGESTKMANFVKVPRYAGIDSDPNYVANLRRAVSSHFRFYFADCGKTVAWGVPENINLPKNIWNYEMAPLMSETLPFDVYMVDGRYRVECALTAFLHASDRWRRIDNKNNHNKNKSNQETTVLLHDCRMRKDLQYKPLFDESAQNRDGTPMFEWSLPTGANLCILKRHPETRDEDIEALWRKQLKNPDRVH